MNKSKIRKHGVFSLGCIFLGLTSFIVKPHEGVATLDEARGKCSGPNQSDGRLCLPRASTKLASLKPQIGKQMDDLLGYMRDATMMAAAERLFIGKS